jgi:hypothetical protein
MLKTFISGLSFGLQFKSVQLCPKCELRERSVSVLRFRFIDKEYYIFMRVIHFLRSDAF